MINIQEGPEDVDAIRLGNKLAFGRPVEADIVESNTCTWDIGSTFAADQVK